MKKNINEPTDKEEGFYDFVRFVWGTEEEHNEILINNGGKYFFNGVTVMCKKGDKINYNKKGKKVFLNGKEYQETN
jgi:hypothetical protein